MSREIQHAAAAGRLRHIAASASDSLAPTPPVSQHEAPAPAAAGAIAQHPPAPPQPAAAAAASAATDPPPQKKKIGVLFVCLGNICRSPSAEAVFRAAVERCGLADRFDIDSCGTGGGSSDWFTEGGWSYHQGDPADPRMTAAARRRGVELTSRSRPMVAADFARFPYVVAMDSANVRDIAGAADHWRDWERSAASSSGAGAAAAAVVPQDHRSRVSLMTSYCSTAAFQTDCGVPDPYYGGAQGFDLVLDLLDDACDGLLQDLRTKHAL